MLEWITTHNTVLQLAISFVTLGIWIFYAQILLAQYRRTKRPKILINQTRGRTLHSRFLVSNMSLESVHIEVILVGLFNNDEQTWHLVSDWEPMQEDSQADTNAYGTFQGPLAAGCSLDIGDIKRLISQRHAEDHKRGEAGLVTDQGIKCRSFEIMVVGVYSSENGVIGASRTFDIDEHGHIHPRDAETRQCRSRNERRRMQKLHRRYL